MASSILKGFVKFSGLIKDWLKEADQKRMLKDGLDLDEIAHFIVISLNGAAPLYAATRDSRVWKQTVSQLRYYIDQLRR